MPNPFSPVSPFGGPGLFSGIPPLMTLFLVIFGCLFFYAIGKSVVTAVNNASQPVVERAAQVTGKRQSTHVSGGTDNMPATSSTSHFVTFEFADGSREEFRVRTGDYAMLAEGDMGMLRSQGTWFKGFERGVWREG